jgi:hypothetical protein
MPKSLRIHGRNLDFGKKHNNIEPIYRWTLPRAQPRERQGCSTLFIVVHIAQGFEASECGGVAILGDGFGLMNRRML